MQKHIFHVPIAAWTLHGEEMLQRAKSRFDMYISKKLEEIERKSKDLLRFYESPC